jgi:hypothetical protein
MLLLHKRRFLRLLVIPLAVFTATFLWDYVSPTARRRRHCPDVRVDFSSDHPSSSPLGSHEYLSNGLVVVNPDGLHPILELIRNAEEQWNAKLARASQSLEEAVVEYKRR